MKKTGSQSANLALSVIGETPNEEEETVVQRARRTRPNQVSYFLNTVRTDSEQSLLQVKGLINEIEFDCVIDTGATMSVMSERVAKTQVPNK